MTDINDHILWNKILTALRKQYSNAQPEIIEVIPDRPIRFHIRDSAGKLSFYSVNYRINDSEEILVDWSTVELTDPF